MEIVTTTQRIKHLAERGLTTVEYAIGLLAAAAAALVLVRIFNDNAFFETLFNWVVDVFNSISQSSSGNIFEAIGQAVGGLFGGK